MITRPTEDRIQWTPDEANVDILDSGKQSLGFVFKEKLGSKVMNWIVKRFSTWLGWTIDRIDDHETVANVNLTLSAGTYDYIQEFFDNLKHNDYAITVSGTIDDITKVLRIENIYGKGTINFNGATLILGGIVINNVQQELVTFNQDFGTNIRQTSQYGLKITNALNVSFENLNLTLESFNATNWVMMYVDNSKLSIYQPSFNGSYTGYSAPTNMIKILNNSIVNISQNYTIQSNAGAGAVIGQSMIYVDSTSFYDLGAVPTFTNWAQNYSAQVEMIHYPKTSYPIIFNIQTGYEHVINLIANIESINCDISTVGINDDLQNLVVENIDGCGSLEISSVYMTSGCIVDNCNCVIILDDIEVPDSDTNGVYALKVRNNKDVRFNTQTVLDAGTQNYECILIDNSKVYFEDLRYIVEPSTPATNYIDIKTNSDVYFKRILSGHASIIIPDSIFISISSGSKASVNNWVPAHGDTTALKFKTIEEGSTVVGYESGGYISAYNTTDIAIITKP